MTTALEELKILCSLVPERLKNISEADFRRKPEGKWSAVEILGHLIDSAANNHQRFMRARIQTNPVIFYEQDEWVKFQNYQEEDVSLLINLWSAYNKHLVHVISNIAPEDLDKTTSGRDGKATFTLSYLIEDYVSHLKHHLNQINGISLK